MKRENIYVGMRVKVKKSCAIVDWRGKYATVIDPPCEGLAKFAVCLIDGLHEKQVLDINAIKISDEKPVVGDRIVVVRARPTHGGQHYDNGASGIVRYTHNSGVPRVCFDRIESGIHPLGEWFVEKSLGQKYAIVRDVESLK